MCLGIWNISVLLRGSSGWRVHRLQQLEGRLDICECVQFVFCHPSLICCSKCAGKTPNGQDFEAFIGAEKAAELKLLFTSWVQTVYRELLSTIRWYQRLLVFRSSCV